ncbi:MAG: right-handed parallel beta-helix repeat-containing protein, partial [Planctomycetota bacterium]
TNSTTSFATLDYCDYSSTLFNSANFGGSGTTTINNTCIICDPLFVDTSTGNYRLKKTSVAVDRGNDSLVPSGLTGDVDGRQRISGVRVDLGAYEGACILVPDDYADIQTAINAASAGDVILVANGTYTGGGNKELNFDGKAIRLQSLGGSSVCIIDCQNSGRAFHFQNSETASSEVIGFTIRNGSVGDDGAGILCNGASPTLLNCIITNCTASGRGGGIYCVNGANPTITSFKISNCSADYGGGIYCFNNANPIITRTRIEACSATNYGGGIYWHWSSSPVLTNNAITDNSAICGGGVFASGGTVTISNSTIANNTASNIGGGVYGLNSAVMTINNSVLWDNIAVTTGSQIFTNGATASVTLNYCDYANDTGDIAGNGTFSAQNSITSDPQFVNVTNRDYHLRRGSGCIDTGDNSINPSGTSSDLEGRTRTWGTAMDIGAFEGGWLFVPSGYATIQAAVDAASNGDYIVVENGIYTGTGNKNIDFGGKLIYMKSQNGAGNCIIDCENDGRAFIFQTSENTNAVVYGFTIRNGNATEGGAIYCTGATPRIYHCTITNNNATNGGAIFATTNSNMGIYSCTITNNTAITYGGGIYCNGSSPTISGCTISNNTLTDEYSHGGGIYCISSSNPHIVNCTIRNNTAVERGGGIYCQGTSNIKVSCCLITNNSVTGESGNGGGVYAHGSSPFLNSCTIAYNTVEYWGGGLFCWSTSTVTVNNVILWGNTATDNGNQIYHDNGTQVLLNNCNYPNASNDVAGIGTLTAQGSINSNPLFTDIDNNNYTLQPASPCIDTGDTWRVPVTTDIRGLLRIVDGDENNVTTIDIGAYEYQP